jgi:hypothetical protein
MSYRNDLDALTARHDALSTEVEAKTRELERATRMLDEAKARARLPILDNIRVATPCPKQWVDMAGDERVRHCGDCQKNVYNLSDMTREEAETLIIAKEGKLCVRYFQRKDGTILMKDCSVGLAKKRRRTLVAAGAAAILAAGGAGLALKLTGSIGVDGEHEEIMGDMPARDIAGGLSIDMREMRELHDVRGRMVETVPDIADQDPALKGQ